jgi:hypothetical protein
MPNYTITIEIVNDYSNGTAMVRLPDGQSILTAKSNLVEVVIEEPTEPEPEKPLNELTVPTLQSKALELGIETKGLNKADLISAIESKMSEQQPAQTPSEPVTPPAV